MTMTIDATLQQLVDANAVADLVHRLGSALGLG
jgi:hypothetical protein